RVSQPALSRALRGLEAELGVALLARSGRHVELTDDGHRVLEVARRVVRDVDSLRSPADQVTRLCSTPTQARELCAGAIARLAQLAPELRVALETEDSAAAVVREVVAGRAG